MQSESTSPAARPSLFGAIKDSVIEVGGVSITGGAAGALAGKAVSALPYKPSETALNFQYTDMFEKAVRNETVPEYIEKTGGALKNAVNKGREIFSNHTALQKDIIDAEVAKTAVKNTTDAVISDDTLELVKTVLNKGGVNTQQPLSKENILAGLDDICKKLTTACEEAANSYGDLRKGFVENAAKPGNEKVLEIAKKGAKQLHKHSIMGAGIAIGVVTALALNLLKSYGVSNKRKPDNSAQRAQTPLVQSAQTAGQNPKV